MKDLMRIGDFHFSQQGFVYEVVSDVTRDRTDVTSSADQALNYEDIPRLVGDFEIIPFGENNDLPTVVRDTVSKHNLAPRIFTKRAMLTWGQGPFLYRKRIDPKSPNKVTREFVEDQEVMNWLKSWNYIDYLRHAIVDFNYMEGFFTKVFRSRGARIGMAPKVSMLEHIPISDARFSGKNLRRNKPTHVAVSRWGSVLTHDKIDFYPLCTPLTMVDKPVSAIYSKMVGFGQRYYSSPDVLGTLPWLRRASDVPFVLEALTNNSLHIKWHIKSPARYWEDKADKLKEMCSLKNTVYKPEMLEELKEATFKQLTNILGGKSNVGKFWASEKVVEVMDTKIITHEWEIEPIDQKIKDFVESQIKISERTDFTTVAGLGLHQALSNISANGKSDSGSEQLYAYKNFMLSEVHMPEMIITQPINRAIEINWPEKDIQLGFYRELPEREEDITPSKRVTNAV